MSLFFLFSLLLSSFFFFNDPATTEIYTLSLHDALPICRPKAVPLTHGNVMASVRNIAAHYHLSPADTGLDRKSTRLNSSHTVISYAVFCLKKKKKKNKYI